VLTFVCLSTGNPKGGNVGGPRGAAWFFSTSRDLSDPNAWSAPREIIGSWNVFPDDQDPLFNGWYPTFMSLAQEPSRLTARGFAFYLWGRTGGGCAPNPCGLRQFASRRFTIQTTDNVYSRAPRTTITGHTQPLHPNGTTTFDFRSNEPGSAFECSLDGSRYAPCRSPATVDLAEGLNTFAVRAINPFGLTGDAAESRVPFSPVLRR